MIKDWRDLVTIDGKMLKNRIASRTSDSDLLAFARHNQRRYQLSEESSRLNMFKVQDDFKQEMKLSISCTDPWLKEIIQTWSDMSGLPTSSAKFWQDAGFRQAIEAGHNIQIRRYLDDNDGWAWIVVRSTQSEWISRARLGETERQQLRSGKKFI